jgi:hypothetical protein
VNKFGQGHGAYIFQLEGMKISPEKRKLVVLPKTLGLGLGTKKFLGFFEVLVLVLGFMSWFQTKTFHFFPLDLMSFFG